MATKVYVESGEALTLYILVSYFSNFRCGTFIINTLPHAQRSSSEAWAIVGTTSTGWPNIGWLIINTPPHAQRSSSEAWVIVGTTSTGWPRIDCSDTMSNSDLSWDTTDDTLMQAFSAYGNVLDATVIRDRDTGRSRGFGYVNFSTNDEAEAAISGMNDQELDGRRVKVSLANATQTTPGYSGGGGGYM
ncbi:unnamed protein product [Microthlaspi erraticum]|uniref:RRM domain-containing protein n=1 Tax=Microthlaspi erraticum TaxID=1685480 RepID=A0A6D2IMZ8_9BRAS|nr:unnamed protein product [Microthlaspi erraticum]